MEDKVFDLEDLKSYMEEKGYEKLSDFEKFSYLTTSNYGGIILLVNDTNEAVFVQEEWSEGNTGEIKMYPIDYFYNEDFGEEDGMHDLGFKDEDDNIYFLHEFMVNR